jgi:hypothetical protein
MAGDDYIGDYNESEWTDLVAISARGYRIVGLKADGTVVSSAQSDVSDWTDIKLPKNQ